MPAAVINPPNAHHNANSPPSPLDDSSSSRCSARNTYTHLTYSRLHLVGIAMETIKIAENGQYTNSKEETVHLKEDLDYAVENCVHYEHEFDFHAALTMHDMMMRGCYDSSGNSSPGYSDGGTKGRRCDEFRQGSSGTNESKDGVGALRSLSYSSPNRSFTGATGGNGRGTKRFPRTSFLVVSASSLESASELRGARANTDDIRVGVLNSASGTTPGGRFLNGTVSSEDCLCRASLLYSCMSQPKFQMHGRFYGKNRSVRYGSSNCVIFSPDVPVIREDNVEGKLLDSYEKVSFVTIPAPNAFTTSSSTGKEYTDGIECDTQQNGLQKGLQRRSTHDFSSINLAQISSTDFDEKHEQKRRALLASLSDRIHRALSAFVLGNCTDLVLPAFGCGVHGNDPSMVASVFREMLTDQKQFGGRFRTVVFAIPPSRKQNYQAFAAYFQPKEMVKWDTLKRGVTMD